MQAASSAASYVVKSNHIPTPDRKYSLLADFLAKAEIECSPDLIHNLDQRANISFSPVMCEAMAVAFCNQSIDFRWPIGPHRGNSWLEAMSTKVRRESFVPSIVPGSLLLLEQAARALDANFAESNYQYCDLMAVDRGYFNPQHGTDDELPMTHALHDLCKSFKRIQDQRSLHDIATYEQSLVPVLELMSSSCVES